MDTFIKKLLVQFIGMSVFNVMDIAVHEMLITSKINTRTNLSDIAFPFKVCKFWRILFQPYYLYCTTKS